MAKDGNSQIVSGVTPAITQVKFVQQQRVYAEHGPVCLQFAVHQWDYTKSGLRARTKHPPFAKDAFTHYFSV